MAEVIVEVPAELKFGFKELDKKEINAVVCNALKERLSERLMFKLADRLLKDSEMTDELASKLGNELKERVAKKHGL